MQYHFVRGHRYRLHLKRDQDRNVKTTILDYLGDDGDGRTHLFSARPLAGTQTIPHRWVRGAELVSTTVPIQLLK